MKSISFNVCNKKKIYCYLCESIDSLIKKCKINSKYNLQNYLEYYDVTTESNFTPFSLLETLDYEYFYEEEFEESNEFIKHDHFLYKIENIINVYMVHEIIFVIIILNMCASLFIAYIFIN